MPTDTWPTRSSVDVDKLRATRMGVTKHSTISYVRYSFLLRISNFVFKMCCFQIFDFKMSWLEIQSKVTQGHRKWSAFDSSYTSSYSPSIVTMTLSCVVCEILIEISKFYTPRRNFEKLLDVHKTRIIGLRYNIGTWWIDLLYQCRASVCWLMQHMQKLP